MSGLSYLALAALLFGAFYLYLIFYDPRKALAILEVIARLVWVLLTGLFKVVAAIVTFIASLFTRRRR